MLRHIGLQIHEETEAKEFYENILSFKEVNRFILHSKTAKQVFNSEKEIEVIRIKKFDILIELFICPETSNANMAHLAFEFWKADDIISKAEKSSYPVIIFEKPSGSKARYIKDKAGNIFEIKDINLI